jgi:hypothetical protein
MTASRFVRPGRQVKVWHVVGLSFLLFFAMGLFVATGYFRLSGETALLRSSLVKTREVPWNRKIAIHFGPATMAIFRNVLLFVPMEEEARTAIETLRAVEAGVYKMPTPSMPRDAAISLARADKIMTSKKWERVVYVVKDNTLVAVYSPRKSVTAKAMKCCFVVLHEDILVVGSANIKLESILRLVQFDRNHRLPALTLTNSDLDTWSQSRVVPRHSKLSAGTVF